MSRMRRALAVPFMAVAFSAAFSGCSLRADLSVSPGPDARLVGQEITYDSRVTGASNKGRDLKQSFDLDGDGIFEVVDRGDDARATKTYGSPQTFRAGLHVVDNRAFLGFGAVATDSELVTILPKPQPPAPPPSPPPNRAPVAALTATPSAVVAGSTIRFDAGGSRDPDGSIVRYEFDTNGDGIFEQSQSGPVLVVRFLNPGSFPVRVRVTDNQGARAQAQVVVLVQPANQPPVASFTATRFGNDVSLDASASADPDGTIVLYQWDFDNNGTFDFSSSTSPIAGIMNQLTATTIRLRVTDNDGAIGETTRFVAAPAKGRAPGSSGVVAAKVRGRSVRFRALGGRTIREATPTLAGIVVSLDNQVSTGRARFGGTPRRLDLGRTVRWASRIDAIQNAETGRVTGDGHMLMSFPGAGRACLALSILERIGARRPRGEFQIIGGSGKARKLVGGGKFVVRGADGRRPSIRGRGSSSVGEGRPYPRQTCGSLRRFVRR